ncbi:MAG: hypothetical protein HQL80_09070 [Magnetococcales bacterium]|nr:hypothetical protein [Magnetococcales bacterium]
MKNFIRGILLGLMAGVALFWYEGISDYFPAILAAILLVGVLIPLESQERRMAALLQAMTEVRQGMEEIQRRLDAPQPVELAGNQAVAVAKPESEPTPFIPTMQVDTSTSTSAPQKKRTVDRSVGDVAKKLSSMQGR